MITPPFDQKFIHACLEKINLRLDRLEVGPFVNTNSLPHHPSLDKVTIAEAIADEIFAGAPNEKACAFEPNGKPCDHCSMCNSRGF